MSVEGFDRKSQMNPSSDDTEVYEDDQVGGEAGEGSENVFRDRQWLVITLFAMLWGAFFGVWAYMRYMVL